jgi:ribosomal protein L37AE/L43A|tara:strand:- start:739 stop:1269 length:531 start_codon:yes stop_codon:yes gene_type:complete
MAGRSKEAERQNIALKNILDGKPTEKRSMVGYQGEQEKNLGGKTRESELSKIMQSVRMPLFCPKCKKTMKKKLDDKFWRLFEHCWDCQIDFEHKLRLEGKYDEWATERAKKNQRGWIEDMIQSIEQWRTERPVDQIYDVGIKDPEVKIEKAQVNEKALNKLADDAIKDLKKMKENI